MPQDATIAAFYRSWQDGKGPTKKNSQSGHIENEEHLTFPMWMPDTPAGTGKQSIEGMRKTTTYYYPLSKEGPINVVGKIIETRTIFSDLGWTEHDTKLLDSKQLLLQRIAKTQADVDNKFISPSGQAANNDQVNKWTREIETHKKSLQSTVSSIESNAQRAVDLFAKLMGPLSLKVKELYADLMSTNEQAVVQKWTVSKKPMMKDDTKEQWRV